MDNKYRIIINEIVKHPAKDGSGEEMTSTFEIYKQEVKDINVNELIKAIVDWIT